ncbi:MAG: GNAT family N-acetyltransferase [Bacteroidia bacterium]
MKTEKLSVRALSERDIVPLSAYWLEADAAFMTSMGVDTTKIPEKEEWEKMLREQLGQSLENKKSYCLIWEMDGEAIGHSNINKIIYGEEAYMHLHLWKNEVRKKGIGTELVKLSLPYFFSNMRLKKLYCEPYKLNPAPNRTLEKTGFTFLKTYSCIPGWINFEQEVNLWEMKREKFEKMV